MLDSVDEGVGVRAAISYEFDDGDPPDFVDLNPAMEFVCGRGDVAPGLDAGVRGMVVGETRELRFGADNPLFGSRDSQKVIEVPRASLPDCKIGESVLVGEDAGGGRGLVQSLTEATATVDLNHPLAGKAATVWVSVLRCQEAAPLGGVQVETISPGDGKTYARYGDLVTLHCVVTAIRDSKVFESSRKRGEPLRFRVGSGDLALDWEEGISRVSLGERALVRVPAPAVGAGGRYREALMLDVEVLGIVSELELAF